MCVARQLSTEDRENRKKPSIPVQRENKESLDVCHSRNYLEFHSRFGLLHSVVLSQRINVSAHPTDTCKFLLHAQEGAVFLQRGGYSADSPDRTPADSSEEDQETPKVKRASTMEVTAKVFPEKASWQLTL